MTRPGIAHAFASHLRHLADAQRQAAINGHREALLQTLVQTRTLCRSLTSALRRRHQSHFESNLDDLRRLSPTMAMWVDSVRGV